MSDDDIVFTPEHPELDPRYIVRGVVRRGLQPPPPKVAISLRIDEDVLAWFKAKGQGYQTRINAILYAYMKEEIALDRQAAAEMAKRAATRKVTPARRK